MITADHLKDLTPLSVEDKIGRTQFNVDVGHPHFTVDRAKCVNCVTKPCLYVCPVGNFTLDDQGELVVSWEGCVECGAIEVACHSLGQGAVTWRYPQGGYGVRHTGGG